MTQGWLTESTHHDAEVAVVGSGMAAVLLAAELSERAVLVRPEGPDPDASGYVSAGYELADVASMGAARRGAAAWRHRLRRWAVPAPAGTAWCALPERELRLRSWRWEDVGLHIADTTASLPRPFDAGPAAAAPRAILSEDLVIPVAAVVRYVNGQSGVRVVAAVRPEPLVFGDEIQGVEAGTGDGQRLQVNARTVVVATGVESYRSLRTLGARSSGELRRAAYEQRRLGSVARRLVLEVTGALPLVSGWFGPLRVASQSAPETNEVTWHVTDLTVRPQVIHASRWDSLRAASPDPDEVAGLRGRLLALAPEVRSRSEELRWHARVDEGPAGLAEAGPGSPPLVVGIPPAAGRPSLLFLPPVPLSQAVSQADAALERLRGPRGPAGTAR